MPSVTSFEHLREQVGEGIMRSGRSLREAYANAGTPVSLSAISRLIELSHSAGRISADQPDALCRLQEILTEATLEFRKALAAITWQAENRPAYRPSCGRRPSNGGHGSSCPRGSRHADRPTANPDIAAPTF